MSVWQYLKDIRDFFRDARTLDNNGKPVLRVVDAAPFAYDADRNMWKVTREQNKEVTIGQDIEIEANEIFTHHLVIPEYHMFCIYGRCDVRHDFDVVFSLRTRDYSREISDPAGDDPWEGGHGSRKTVQFQNKNGFLIGPLVVLTSVITVQILNKSQQMQRWDVVRVKLFGGNG